MSARSTFLSLIAVFAVVLSAHAVGQAPPAGAPSSADGPPRRADGKPDLTGVWMPPYVPDMTVNRRDQRGYAEAPFSPDDSPQARQALAAKGNKADLPFTAWGLANWSSYDAGQRRLHRQLLSLRAAARGQRAVSVSDHAGRAARRPAVRDQHLAPRDSDRARIPEAGGRQPDLVRLLDRPLGGRHLRRRDARLQRLHAARHRSAIRTATRCI